MTALTLRLPLCSSTTGEIRSGFGGVVRAAAWFGHPQRATERMNRQDRQLVLGAGVRTEGDTR